MFHALVYLAIIGLIAYLVEAYVPMAPPFKLIFRIICVVIAVYILLGALGMGVPPVRW